MTQRSLVYFLSDLHLGASYIPDRVGHERRVVDFLRSIAPTAKALYLLGDVLDYWFEYRTVVPRGYVRFFGQLADMADSGIEITWFTGNHDIWLFDYLRDELGIKVVQSPAHGGILENIGNTLFCLSHGDTFGPQPLSYRALRAVFHNRICQKLYGALHPRWTLPFAHGWSSHSRKGNRRRNAYAVAPSRRQSLESTARSFASRNPGVRFIVIGHHHIPMDVAVGENCRLIVLGDWITHDTYAVFDGVHLDLKAYDGSGN